jgi:hypothetical protein
MLKKIFYFLIFLFTKITIIPEKIILRKYSLNSIEFNYTVLAKYPTLIGRGAPRSYTTLTTTHNQTCAAIYCGLNCAIVCDAASSIAMPGKWVRPL